MGARDSPTPVEKRGQERLCRRAPTKVAAEVTTEHVNKTDRGLSWDRLKDLVGVAASRDTRRAEGSLGGGWVASVYPVRGYIRIDIRHHARGRGASC